MAVNDALASKSCVDSFGDITRRLLILEVFVGVGLSCFVEDVNSEFEEKVSSFEVADCALK